MQMHDCYDDNLARSSAKENTKRKGPGEATTDIGFDDLI